MTGGVVAVIGVLGLVVGSFANVVIYRVPRKLSVVKPRSACGGCGATIAAYDNLPLISFLVLRGRCRKCGSSISFRYPLVEAITAALFVAIALRYGLHPALPAFLVLAASLVCISLIDLERFVVPKVIVYPTGLIVAALLLVASIVNGDWRAFGDAALGCAIAFCVMLVIHLVSPKGMGFGDVRLAALVGLGPGYLGLAEMAIALFAAFAIGAVVGIVMMMFAGKSRKARMPFAPALAAGCLVGVLWGHPLATAWLR